MAQKIVITAELITLIENRLNLFCDDLRGELQRRGHTASGDTANSIVSGVKRTNEGITAQVEAAEWLFTLQQGRGPGKVPFNFKDVLIRWAMYKHIQFDSPEQMNSFAYLLARKIRNEGTALFRTNGQVPFAEGYIAKMIQELEDDLVKIVNDYVVNNINNYLYREFTKKI